MTSSKREQLEICKDLKFFPFFFKINIIAGECAKSYRMHTVSFSVIGVCVESSQRAHYLQGGGGDLLEECAQIHSTYSPTASIPNEEGKN
jgi:hypothetical protein